MAKRKKTLLVSIVLLTATLLAGWTFDSRDRREYRNGVREERGTSGKRDERKVTSDVREERGASDKRDDNGFWKDFWKFYGKEEGKPSRTNAA